MRRDVAIIGVALVAIGLAPAPAGGDGLPGRGRRCGPRPASRPRAPPPVTSRCRWAGTRWSPRVRRAGGEVLAHACGARLVHGPGGRARRVAERARGGRADARADQPAAGVPAREDQVRRARRPPARDPGDRHARRRLQLRRAVARRRHDVPDPVHVAAGPDALQGTGVRPAPRPSAARPDRRPARAGRADARLSDHARDESRRPLGVHALRRRGRAPVHPRARHERRRRPPASTSTRSRAGRTSQASGWRSAATAGS